MESGWQRETTQSLYKNIGLKVLRPEMLLSAFGLKAKLVEVAGLAHPTVCVLERVRDEDFRETEIAT